MPDPFDRLDQLWHSGVRLGISVGSGAVRATLSQSGRSAICSVPVKPRDLTSALVLALSGVVEEWDEMIHPGTDTASGDAAGSAPGNSPTD